MRNLPEGWKEENDKLTAVFKCADFKAALRLVNTIGALAEEQQHHPDVGIKNYNQVFVNTSTHSENSITEKDFKLANAISKIKV